MSNVQVIDQGSVHAYRTEIPNIVCMLRLSPFELALYVHLKRTAGDDGECRKSTETLAEETGISIGMISKLKAALAAPRAELNNKSLIVLQERKRAHGGKPQHIIRLVDIWPENMAALAAARARREQATSPGEVANSWDEQATSPGEIKKIPSEEQIEGGRERARDADASGTQRTSHQPADEPPIEEPTRAADLPPAAVDADRATVYARWQEIWGAWANGTPPARLARVFDDWAAVHGWSGISATLRYADGRYDLAANPNVINLLGAMLENARADGRPYGTHTTQYEQHKQERQHGPRGAARAPRWRGRRRDAAAGPDHSVQPAGQTNGQPDAAGAAVERPAPRFVQRLRAQAAQAEQGGR
jgi:hypothetical protein